MAAFPLYHCSGFRSDRAFPPSLVSWIMARLLTTTFCSHGTPPNERFAVARFGQMRRACVCGGLKRSMAELPPVYRTLDPGQGSSPSKDKCMLQTASGECCNLRAVQRR